MHEAGHAVLDCALGFAPFVDHVTVVADAESDGCVAMVGGARREAPTVTRGDRDWERFMARLHAANCVSLEAGGAAVRLAGHTPTGCENDLLAREHSACQVLELLGVLPQVWRQHALRAAEQYLREHWRTVERVAMALRNEGTLPQERLLELVGELPFPEMRELFGALDYWEQRAAARRAAS